MQVREAMSTTLITVGPGHTLRQAAQLMTSKRVGAAVVIDPEEQGPGILTERDMLRAVANGVDVDNELVAAHMSPHSDLVFASLAWSLDDAADAMAQSGFRHLIVMDGGEIAGIVSVRDIVKCWSDGRAAAAAAGAGQPAE